MRMVWRSGQSEQFRLAQSASFFLLAISCLFASATGSWSQTIIKNICQLQSINTNAASLSGNFMLGADIKASDVTCNGGVSFSFVPIGNDVTPFVGVFDGQGHTIDQLSVLSEGQSGSGLFGHIGASGTVRNVGLTNAVVQSGNSLRVGGGVLASINAGTISNSYAVGNITGGDFTSNLGGLVGTNAGLVTQSYANVSVRGTGSFSYGGLVGDNGGGTISQSYAAGSVTGATAGGLVGFNAAGIIKLSYSTAAVGGGLAAGLVGWSFGGTIDQTYAAGSVSGAVGAGLVGLAQNSVAITASYWDTQTTTQPNSAGAKISCAGNYCGMTTEQLQAHLPNGFDNRAWGIVPNVTYPYLLWEPGFVFGFDAASISQPDPIDWNSLASSHILYNAKPYAVSFAILRASKGASDVDNCQFEDPTFNGRANGASSVQLTVGAYHVAGIRNRYTNQNYSPISEAAFFVSVAGEWIKPGNMRPFLDIEDDACYPNRTKSKELATWVDQWMQEVGRLTGVTPIIYINSIDVNGIKNLADKYELWVAENSCVRSSRCDPGMPINLMPWVVDLIQYDWNGQLPGINNAVDLDVFQHVRQAFDAEVIIGR